jgi:NAD-dependent SIR2 family protein deacetylase
MHHREGFEMKREGTLQDLVELMRGKQVVALTGAGCSTESGIPDYRGPETKRRARNPIKFLEFIKQPGERARYWSRSMIGWPRLSEARPNAGHLALAALEDAGVMRGIITQNVDRLHHAAGSKRVIELHGALAEVCCLDCGEVEQRDRFQQRLLGLNPSFDVTGAEIAPDGDAELPRALARDFRVPGCRRCLEGTLKPNVVFFGENVPKPTVERAFSLLEEADLLLVIGSSLTVYSGYRFVRRAAEIGMPVAIINIGETRGHKHAQVAVDAPIGEVLPALVKELGV